MNMLSDMATTGTIGAIVGAYATLQGLKEQARQAEHERWLKALQAAHGVQIQEADAAANRKIDGGKVMRYIVISCLMFATVLAVAFMPLIHVPIIVRDEIVNPEWLFGLIPATTKVTYTALFGYYLIPVLLDGVSAVIGFLLGSAAVRLKA